MNGEPEPLPDVLRALLGRIRTLDHLEVLLLVSRTPDRQWTAADVAQELFGDTRLTAQLLRDLVHTRLLTVIDSGRRRDRDSFRFAPDDDADLCGVEQLRSRYDRDPFAIIRAMRAIRPRSIESLADAFRFRPRQEDDRG